MTVLAISAHTYWVIALVIGLVAALVVAALLAALVRAVMSIEKSVDGLLVVATQSPATRPTSPSSRRRRPCWG